MNLRGSRAAFLSHGEANMLDQLTLVWGRPVLCRTFSSSSDASGAHSPQVCQPEVSPDVTKCPLGGAQSPQLRSTDAGAQDTGPGASLPEVAPWFCPLYAVGPWTS